MRRPVHEIETITRQRELRDLHECATGKLWRHEHIAANRDPLTRDRSFDCMQLLAKRETLQPREVRHALETSAHRCLPALPIRRVQVSGRPLALDKGEGGQLRRAKRLYSLADQPRTRNDTERVAHQFDALIARWRPAH